MPERGSQGMKPRSSIFRLAGLFVLLSLMPLAVLNLIVTAGLVAVIGS